MTPKERATATMALEALEMHAHGVGSIIHTKLAWDALREALERPVSQEQNSMFMEGYRIGLAEMREKCATVVTEHAPTCSPHWVSYVVAIRAIKFEGDTGFRPVSEMVAEHKQDPKKAAAIEKAKMRKVARAEKIAMPSVYEVPVEKAEQEPEEQLSELGYAARLARELCKKHYPDCSENWKPLDSLYGVLTQIDNMVSGLIRNTQSVQEPVVMDESWCLEPQPVNGLLSNEQAEQEPVGVVTDEMKVLLKEGDSPCAIAMRFGGRIGTVEYNKLYIPLEKLAEQAEQEPVGRWNWNEAKFEWLTKFDYHKHHMTPLYAAPVRTKDLTDDEIFKLFYSNGKEPIDHYEFARAVIAAYKEKNRDL